MADTSDDKKASEGGIETTPYDLLEKDFQEVQSTLQSSKSVPALQYHLVCCFEVQLRELNIPGCGVCIGLARTSARQVTGAV